MPNEWFILQFKPNSHYQAVKNLNRQGFETFLPLHDTTTRKVSRFVATTKPLFPGYMFIAFDRAETKWHKINNTYGVSRLVTFNSFLKPVPSFFVNNLKKRYNLLGQLIPVKNLKRGDQVEILNGPFAEFIATVEEYESDHRISVLINLMGRKTIIQTPTRTVQPLN